MTATGVTHEFAMPSLGADMDDGVVTEWLVAPGDEVQRGQVVVVVETDKSDIEVEVFEHAVVEELLVAEGTRVAVGVPIARLRRVDAAGGPVPAESDAPPAAEPPTLEPPAPEPPTPEPPLPVSTRSAGAVAVTSPLVRHLIDELHVDPGSIRGTGPGGRIHRDDVVEAASARAARVTPRARVLAARFEVDLGALVSSAAGDAPVIDGDAVLAVAGTDTEIVEAASALTDAGPSTGPSEDPMRRAVAAVMARSWAEIPHFHVAARVDVAVPMGRLSEVNAGRPPAARVLPAALMLHAVAAAARRVPAVNGWWVDGRFLPADHVDLGVVVSLRRGGIVAPTIARADELTVEELMQALVGMVARARAGKLRGSDMVEASLTVTNLGDLGADLVHGVIHPPQVALIGFGSIHDEVVAVGDGLMGVHPVVHATLAGDHRAIDGMVGAGFLTRWRNTLEDSASSILDDPPDRQTEEPT